MAEIVGLALAAPGVIDVILRFAAVVHDKIDAFKHIDATTAKFRDLSSNIKEGTLFFALTNIQAASLNRLIPPGILTQLDRALGNVEDALDNAQQGISCVREDKLLGKLKYALWQGEGGKSKLDKQFRALKSSCDELKELCLQLHQHRTVESCFLLTSDLFKLRHEKSNRQPGCALPDSDIWIAKGNYVLRGQRIVSDFVLETKTRENDVKFLCTKLNKSALGELQESLLSVLGYRVPPYNLPDGAKVFQVVVELPPDLERDSLSHILSTRSPPELLERLKICKNLALATKAVHSIGLVHKAIRARSILMLSKPGDPHSAAKTYLQDWNCVREVSGATREIGEAFWPKRIYQHPERQGEYAEAFFETRHDLYSLSVCMLEVLLWRPFVVVERGGAVEALKVCGLFEQYGFAHAEKDGGLPERYRGDSVKMTSRPWITKTIWEDIAKAELANPELAQLVLQCLQGDVKTARDVELHVDKLIAA